MQYADLMRPDEDWRGLGDPSERRKIQNRIAQRAYRRNMRERANKIEELKKQLATYEELRLQITQDEENTFQPGSSTSILPPNNNNNKRNDGGWCPPAHPDPSNDTQFNSNNSSSIMSPTKRADGGWGPSQQLTPPNDPQFGGVLPPNNKRGWCPPPQQMTPPQHADSPNESPFGRVQQQQVVSSPIEQQQQQSGNSPRPTTLQRMGPWPPANGQRPVIEPITPASSLPLETGMSSGGILSLGAVDLSAGTTYEDFDFMPDLVSKSPQSTSLLHMAVAGNHIDTIKVLLQDERVLIDERDSEGYTPLQRAVMSGRSDIVQLLLSHSADTGPVRGGTPNDGMSMGSVGGFGTNFPTS